MMRLRSDSRLLLRSSDTSPDLATHVNSCKSKVICVHSMTKILCPFLGKHSSHIIIFSVYGLIRLSIWLGLI